MGVTGVKLFTSLVFKPQFLLCSFFNDVKFVSKRSSYHPSYKVQKCKYLGVQRVSGCTLETYHGHYECGSLWLVCLRVITRNQPSVTKVHVRFLVAL